MIIRDFLDILARKVIAECTAIEQKLSTGTPYSAVYKQMQRLEQLGAGIKKTSADLDMLEMG